MVPNCHSFICGRHLILCSPGCSCLTSSWRHLLDLSALEELFSASLVKNRCHWSQFHLWLAPHALFWWFLQHPVSPPLPVRFTVHQWAGILCQEGSLKRKDFISESVPVSVPVQILFITIDLIMGIDANIYLLASWLAKNQTICSVTSHLFLWRYFKN